jgi:hypothetical protein
MTGVTPLLRSSIMVSVTTGRRPEWPWQWQLIRLRMAALTISSGMGPP